MAFRLSDAMLRLEEIDCREQGLLILPDDHLTPGCLVTVCALAHIRGYSFEQIQFGNSSQIGYAQAIGMELALNGNDSYGYERVNAGANYSPVAKLDCAESTDSATSLINSCLRSFSPGEVISSVGFSDLCHVVGEMHSNVWDHGMDTGFSVAQKSKVPYEDDFYFEFALADSGYGFPGEMRRAGKYVNSDIHALKWCIHKGNSTKRYDNRDEYAQRVPSDMMGTIGPELEVYHSDGFDNHHQGLGLYHLTKLITETKGTLCLVSGRAIYKIGPNGGSTFVESANEWKGVALSCRLRTSAISTLAEPENESVEDIFKLLKGE